jgi:hypothetical protein
VEYFHFRVCSHDFFEERADLIHIFELSTLLVAAPFTYLVRRKERIYYEYGIFDV